MTKKDEESPAAEDHPEKKTLCRRCCQSSLCLPAVLLAVAAGVAVMVPVVLLSTSIRDRFPPEQPWWQKSIIYQIYPRSFQDSNGDGVGDLKGIIQRLYYFTELNVGAIWISPFYPSPMKDFGYDVSNYTDIDPLFGTLGDFDDLLKKAHDKDIRVILDFVAGHTSSEHEWFTKSVNRTPPYEDYYIWANGTTLPNGTHVPPSNWVSVFGYSAWTWNNDRQQFYYHAFLPEQPTLNYRNDKVVTEMQNVLKFWLDRGVDGFRVDAVSNMMVYENYTQDQARSYTPGTEWWEDAYYITNLTRNRPEVGDIVRGWRTILDSYDDSNSVDDHSKFLVVEVYDPPEVRNQFYHQGADMPFNFDLLTVLDNQYRVLHSNYCDAICIHDAIQTEYVTLPNGTWANFVLSNHDNHRIASRMGSAYVDSLNMLLLTLRGTPTTYYGEEIGMEDVSVSYNDTQDPKGINYGQARYQAVSRDPERSPMQWNNETNAGFSNASHTWLPVNPHYPTRNVQEEKLSKNTTHLKVYRELALLRDEPAFRYGFFQFADVTPSILSYLRTAIDRAGYLVVINFGNTTISHAFSAPTVNVTEATVKVVTSDAANEGRFVKGATVSLTSLSLKAGDGVVFELPRSE